MIRSYVDKVEVQNVTGAHVAKLGYMAATIAASVGLLTFGTFAMVQNTHGTLLELWLTRLAGCL